MLDRHALDAAREVGRPRHGIRIGRVHLLNDRHFLRREIAVPAELLEHAEREFGVAVHDRRADRIGAFGEQVLVDFLLDLLAVLHDLALDHPLDAEARAEGAAALLHRQVGVVEDRGARMLELRRSPAGPRQAVEVAADLRIVLGRAQRDEVELRLVAHVRLEPLRRLAAIAGRPAAAVDLAQNVLCGHRAVLDLDILEHAVGETELLREHVHHVVVVLRLEDRRNDLLAPLDRPVRRRTRAVHLEAGAGRQQVGAVLAVREHRPGGRIGIAHDEELELLDPAGGLRHPRDRVAAMPHDEHRLEGCRAGRPGPSATRWRRTSACSGCPRSPSTSCWRSATASTRSRPPTPGTNASRRLR